MQETSQTTAEIGRRGEQIAVEYFIAQGFEIVERNWRAGCGQDERGEIDIIATRDNVLHFIEVKTRFNSTASGDFAPTTSFSKRKQFVVMRAAQKYIGLTGYCGNTSLDLCAINLLPDGTHFLHHFLIP